MSHPADPPKELVAVVREPQPDRVLLMIVGQTTPVTLEQARTLHRALGVILARPSVKGPKVEIGVGGLRITTSALIEMDVEGWIDFDIAGQGATLDPRHVRMLKDHLEYWCKHGTFENPFTDAPERK